MRFVNIAWARLEARLPNRFLLRFTLRWLTPVLIAIFLALACFGLPFNALADLVTGSRTVQGEVTSVRTVGRQLRDAPELEIQPNDGGAKIAIEVDEGFRAAAPISARVTIEYAPRTRFVYNASVLRADGETVRFRSSPDRAPWLRALAAPAMAALIFLGLGGRRRTAELWGYLRYMRRDRRAARAARAQRPFGVGP